MLAILNPQIRHTAIDGALFPEEAERLWIQAVPSVCCNGEPLHSGRSTLGELLEQLKERIGTRPAESATIEQSYDVVVAGGGPA